MNKIYLGIGTNLGDKYSNLEQALNFLSEKVDILKKSSIYETEPVGFKDQPMFLNMVIEGETDLSPYDLLCFTQSIERKMKRIKTLINGPRIIDIDILLYEDKKIEMENLIIPHPRMLERAFVMVPLYEVSPNLVISGESIKGILENLIGEKINRQ